MAVSSNNAFIPKSVYESNKDGIKVARPDIIIPTDNIATSFFTINRSIAQINSQEVLFLSRHDLVDSPFISQPRFLKDTGVSAKIAQPLANRYLWTLISLSKNGISLFRYIPEFQEPVSVNSNGNLEIALSGLKENYSIQLEFVSPTPIV